VTRILTECAVCAGDIETFLDLGESPLANKLPQTVDDKEDFIPLQVAVCTTCWLVQQTYVPAAADVFEDDYSFYSGTSPALVAHHKTRAQELLKLFPQQARRLTLEVACNDGDLLRHFQEAGCRTLGVDPAVGPVEVARERGLTVWLTSFDVNVAAEIRNTHGPVGLLIANHVVAHVEDLVGFMTAVRSALARDGVASLEFQYLPDLLLGNQLDHVYHEHRYYLSLTALKFVCDQVGLDVIDARRVSPQGGSLQVTLAIRGDGTYPAQDPGISRRLLSERWLRQSESYHGTQGRAEYLRTRLQDELAEAWKIGSVAGYGMPAKAATLLNFCGIGPDTLTHIIDSTPHKIGRLSPGMKIPIVGLGDRPDPVTYLLFVWNYRGTVIQREVNFIKNGGRFIIPIPVPLTTKALGG